MRANLIPDKYFWSTKLAIIKLLILIILLLSFFNIANAYLKSKQTDEVIVEKIARVEKLLNIIESENVELKQMKEEVNHLERRLTKESKLDSSNGDYNLLFSNLSALSSKNSKFERLELDLREERFKLNCSLENEEAVQNLVSAFSDSIFSNFEIKDIKYGSQIKLLITGRVKQRGEQL